MTTAMIALIIAGIKSGVPLAFELAALARSEGALSDEHKQRIESQAELTDDGWDAVVENAKNTLDDDDLSEDDN